MQQYKYEILGVVGQGQFGQVFCAVRRETGEIVALKEIDRQKLSTSNFLRELRLLLTLNHPNIINCQGIEHDEDKRYLVMDYCAGGTLRDLINYCPSINIIQKLNLISDILSALNHIHQKQIIHRDLKPENILLNVKPHGWLAHISDFGIAKSPSEIANSNMTLGDTGSPAYMAPEQFYGKYSLASDIYAVGIILFELLVGKRPFSGSPKELMIAHINQPIIVPDVVPFILRSSITTALQKLPNNRFAFASDMLKSIKMASEVLTITPVDLGEDSSLNFHNNSSIFNGVKISYSPFKVISQQYLATPVSHIIGNLKQIFLVTEQRLIFQNYYSNIYTGKLANQIEQSFAGEIISLYLVSQGCLILTQSFNENDSLNNYYFYYLGQDIVDKHSLKVSLLLSTKNEKIVSNFDTKKECILIFEKLITKNKEEFSVIFKNLQIWQLKLSQKILINRDIPEHLISLYDNQFLAIYTTDSQKENLINGTKLVILNAQGEEIRSFYLPIKLSLVTSSLKSSEQIIALENQEDYSALLINFQPFTIKRIPLNINPSFIIAQDEGYILADAERNLAMVNYEGENKGYFRLPNSERKITAIASLESHKVLIATWAKNQSIVYILDLTQSEN